MNSKIKKITKLLKNQINDLYQSRLTNLVLFGSQARNEAVEGSDIDVLIVLKDEEINTVKEVRKITDLIASLSLEFNEVISCVFVSEKRYLTEKSPLLLNIRKEGVIL
ncbi:MAG: nucleotidyltransferase domain-containing protein [Candidatus Gastranaerophilaceae bacterium]|jgi:predicted nucleotidyltransferase